MPTAKEQLFSPREPLAGGSRPLQLESASFTYHALPEPTRKNLREPIVFRLDPSAQRVSTEATLITRVTLGSLELFGNGRSAINTGPCSLPADAKPNTSGNADPKPTRARAIFEALRLDVWSSTEVEYLRGEAELDLESCTGTLTSAAVVSARAVIPDLLYAFRRCAAGCAQEEGRADELWFVGPPSSWTASSAGLEPEAKPKTRGFTLASVPLRRGSSASMLLHTDWNQVAFFIGMRATGSPVASRDVRVYGQRLELTAELAWPAERSSPEAMAYVSGLTPNAAEMLHAARSP